MNHTQKIIRHLQRKLETCSQNQVQHVQHEVCKPLRNVPLFPAGVSLGSLAIQESMPVAKLSETRDPGDWGDVASGDIGYILIYMKIYQYI